MANNIVKKESPQIVTDKWPIQRKSTIDCMGVNNSLAAAAG